MERTTCVGSSAPDKIRGITISYFAGFAAIRNYSTCIPTDELKSLSVSWNIRLLGYASHRSKAVEPFWHVTVIFRASAA